MNVSTVIVTFNRKELLIKCIEAILEQTYLPNTIYIIDNASIDGTEELLKSLGFHDTTIDGVRLCYVRLPKNSGGAGGFYTGMKLAHEAGCDAVWVMDDDGLPNKCCLKNLLPYLDKYDYLSPLVIDIENEKMMSFEGCTVESFLKREKDGVIVGRANPFNGVLYSKKLIDAIGYPKKEMFIWGDEINYHLRAITAGFKSVMVVNAIHRHPINRQMYVRYFRNHYMVTSDKDWKLFCYLRNRTYNTKMFFGRWKCIIQLFKDLLKFTCYYTLQVHKPSKLAIVLNAINKGFNGDFSGLDKYLK